MANRVVRPEQLDFLDPGDAEALRSRTDLGAINALMGNFRWVVRELRTHRVAEGIVELGAGEGRLCRLIHKERAEAPLTGLDLIARPAALPEEIEWRQGDVLETLPEMRGGAVVAVMFLHHFGDEALERLGREFSRFRLVCVCEPLRSAWAHALGWGMDPFVGRVTRHDMHVSIDAGFRPGELAGLLGLTGWNIRESIDWRGSLRFVAWR